MQELQERLKRYNIKLGRDGKGYYTITEIDGWTYGTPEHHKNLDEVRDMLHKLEYYANEL